VELSLALGRRPHVQPLLTGAVRVQGYDLVDAHAGPIIGAYRRMVRELSYDVCELAPVTYLMARRTGIPLCAIPVFLERRFHHGDIGCAPGSGIAAPSDLEGRRVGVRAYSVSTGVWVRGMLAHDHGVDLDSITWIVDDDDHLPIPPRANVERVKHGVSLLDLLRATEIDAALSGNAGTGRAGSPRDGWETHESADADRASSGPYPLFRNAAGAALDHHRRTGIYPLHAIVVIRAALVQRDPDLPTRLYAAFAESKRLQRARDPHWDALPHLRQQGQLIAADPLPYGIELNSPSLGALHRFAVEQRLFTDGSTTQLGDALSLDLFAPGDYPDA
jgi:4,5-dihydroxyphthalate decarboxylase